MKQLVLMRALPLLSWSLLACSAPAPQKNLTQQTASQQNVNAGVLVRYEEKERFVKLREGLSIVAKDISEENRKLKYKIDVEYPQLEGSKDARIEKFNRSIAAFASRQVREYRRRQLNVNPKERFPPHHKDVYEYLNMDYLVMYATDEFVSVRFSADTYGRGAAHAVQYFLVTNFDLAKGRPVTLAEMFKPRSNFLKVIADYCINDIKKQPRVQRSSYNFFETYKENLIPVEKNYRTWNVSKEGMVISFDECRIAACSADEIEVIVPYPELKDLLSARGQFAAFLK